MIIRKSEDELESLRALADMIEQGCKINGYDKSRIVHAIHGYASLITKVDSLVEYLELPKFDHPNNFVNVDDIFMRLSD